MSIATCPPPADLERLFLGGLPEKEVEVLEQHVLECGLCLDSLKALFRAKATLTGILCGDTGHDAFDSSPAVENLMTHLVSLPAAPPNRLLWGSAMITFCCSACQKQFSIEEDLAGKQVQCPGCGQVLAGAVRARVAAAAANDLQTLPPAPADSPDPTPAPASKLDTTEGFAATEADHDSSFTNFLAPRQRDDELGRLGKYRILKVLGHGGMGVVFKAEDPKLKRTVAIKAMLPALATSASAGQRFLREAQAMAAVEHDHIVRIYQVDEDRGVPFLAMEFLKGESLDERLKREEKLPLAEVLRVGRESAEALGAAHATGLIHRDIKPGNIWLEAPRGRVKLLDFGLARAAAQEAGLTQQGAIVGTPAYMAPEQARGSSVDARCDLFSLGVVLYRLCTGKQPFVANDSLSTLMEVTMHAPASPVLIDPDLPQELSDLVMKLLEKDPVRRIASAGQVVAALQTLEKKRTRHREAEDATMALSAAPPDRAAARAKQGLSAGVAGRTPPRRRLALLVGALVLLLGGLVGAWLTGLIRFQTDDGDFVIKTDDPDFSFQVARGGGVTLKDTKTGREYRLKVLRHDKATGEYELDVTDVAADLSFKTKTFTIKRGDKVALAAWFERKEAVAVKPPPLDDAWLKEVAALPAEKQVEAVAAKLKELNPGFDGKVTSGLLDGKVVEMKFCTDKVTDISPLRALRGLKRLDCTGSQRGLGQLADLTPLKGLPLTFLDCASNQITDLSPLKGMPLQTLWFPLNKVADLSPLKGLPLTNVVCAENPVSDLSPLVGMSLQWLTCYETKVTDLKPLKGMPLTYLHVGGSPVSDLSPLKGMPLTHLECANTQLTDLSPLKAMPLKAIGCDFKPERDAEILRSIKTLETINGKPMAEFWKAVDEKKP